MEQIFQNLIAQTGSAFAAFTGITLPPVAIVIALVVAFMKGMKLLIKIASVALVIYVVWLCYQAGVIPIGA